MSASPATRFAAPRVRVRIPAAGTAASWRAGARALVGRLTIALLLFAQMLLASYSCPAYAGLGSAEPGTVAAVAASGSAQCHALDPAAPNACLEHCRQGEQGIDGSSPPSLPLALFVALYVLPPRIVTPASTSCAAQRSPALRAALGPPLAVLHCCFRH